MPIYRYRCEDCETVFSALEFAGDPVTENCEHCSSTQIGRIPSVPGVQFKGKGFYATDKRARSNNKKSAEPSKKDTSSDNDSKSNNSDSKTSSGKSEAVTSEK